MNKYPMTVNVSNIPCPECGETGMVFEYYQPCTDEEATLAIFPNKMGQPACRYAGSSYAGPTEDQTDEDWIRQQVYCRECGEIHDLLTIKQAIRGMSDIVEVTK